ncbi:MAG: hypothetical protein RQ723_13225 [Desulfuromonadales bacterium]|nr:hypothetical protein [Desulfuromonadales bacterium]
MAIALSTGLKNQILDGILNSAAGTDFDAGVLELRTGAAPGPDLAAAGTLVAEVAVPVDGFAAAASGSAAKAGTWQDTAANAAGTVAHFRLRASGDVGGASTTERRIEGSVTGTGGGGDIELQNTVVEVGQTITATSLTVSV